MTKINNFIHIIFDLNVNSYVWNINTIELYRMVCAPVEWNVLRIYFLQRKFFLVKLNSLWIFSMRSGWRKCSENRHFVPTFLTFEKLCCQLYSSFCHDDWECYQIDMAAQNIKLAFLLLKHTKSVLIFSNWISFVWYFCLK